MKEKHNLNRRDHLKILLENLILDASSEVLKAVKIEVTSP